MKALDRRDRLLGALYGALIGDAVGVPYEFNQPCDLPPIAQIDMIPPAGFHHTYPHVLPGTWSDDGSLLLCLLEAMLEHPHTQSNQWAREFVNRAQRWRFDGYFAVDGKKFDIGMQTARALTELEEQSCNPLLRVDDATANGNGGLMRSIAPVLVCLTEDTKQPMFSYCLTSCQSIPTHAHVVSRVTCGLYGTIAWHLFNEHPVAAAIQRGIQYASTVLEQHGEHKEALDTVIIPGQFAKCEGSGYVVDSFWSALEALRTSHSYKETIVKSVSYGNDTDTTACIAGGLAGIVYGFQGIPQRWRDGLRGQHLLTPIVAQLLKHHKYTL